MKKLYFFASLFVAMNLGAQSAPKQLRAGLNRPHSLLYFPARSSFIVSNLQGSRFEKDSHASLNSIKSPFATSNQKFKEGFSSLYSNEGKKSGLSAPAGMVLLGDTLAVADLDQIALFKINEDGALLPLEMIPIRGATALGSIVKIGKDSLAVSDAKTHRVYKIEGCLDSDARVISILTSKIKSPTGLYSEDGELFILSSATNYLYIYDLAAGKADRSLAIGPRAKKGVEGFVSMTRGAEGEFYFVHKEHAIVYMYSLNWEGKRYVKPFIRDVHSASSVYYHEDNNALLVTSSFGNSIKLFPALRPRPTSE